MEPMPTESSNLNASIPTPETPLMSAPKKGNAITIVVVAVFILLALGIIAFLYYQNQQLKEMLANSQAQNTPTSTPIIMASPTPNADLPKVSSPSANTKIKSPLTVKGTIPAGWMFEGTFPIKIVDAKGVTLVQAAATEDVAGSWQNNAPVAFTATLTFKTATGSGKIILQNDNPSGIPANSKSFEIPVSF